MFQSLVEWFSDFIRLPSEIRAQNKQSGGITKANVTTWALGCAIAAGCGYMGWWGWCIGIGVSAWIALFFNGEVAGLVGRLLKYATASVLGGAMIGGVALFFGASFMPWCAGSAIALCMGAMLCFGLD